MNKCVDDLTVDEMTCIIARHEHPDEALRGGMVKVLIYE